MAATFKTQLWDNTGWGWDQATAGSPCEQLNSELRSWIATINGNAAQSGKQVALLRDENSSTSANYRGFTLEMPAITTTGSFYFQQFSTSTANLTQRWGNSWDNGTGNGGYGTVSGGSTDTTMGWKTNVTTEGQINVAYGVVNGEEFFSAGWMIDSSTGNADYFIIFKDGNGEWAVFRGDGTTTSGWYYDPLRSTPGWFAIASDTYVGSSTVFTRILLYPSTTGLTTGDQLTGVITSASDDIRTFPSDTTQLTYFPDGATGDNFAKISYYGPYFRYTPV